MLTFVRMPSPAHPSLLWLALCPGSWPLCSVLHTLPCPGFLLPLAHGRYQQETGEWDERGGEILISPQFSDGSDPHCKQLQLLMGGSSSRTTELAVPTAPLLPFVLIWPKVEPPAVVSPWVPTIPC